ncbi:MAG TPA: hypothetical protein VFV08_07565 [Puia sp.]|nr:hypothetical protein [Puia sp.]
MAKELMLVFLFASISINAALIIFFASVYRKIMDGVDIVAFKNLTEMLVRYSSRSLFMIIVLNLPLFIAIPYYYLNGFHNWWITSSLLLWLIGGSISKIIKMPVYKTIAKLENDNKRALNEMRRKLNSGNILQAWLYSISVVIMAFGLTRI